MEGGWPDLCLQRREKVPHTFACRGGRRCRCWRHPESSSSQSRSPSSQSPPLAPQSRGSSAGSRPPPSATCQVLPAREASTSPWQRDKDLNKGRRSAMGPLSVWKLKQTAFFFKTTFRTNCYFSGTPKPWTQSLPRSCC